MMEYKTVYKVVVYMRGGFYSAMYHSLSKDYVVRYEIGKESHPAVGKIFAFDSIYNARRFASINIPYSHSILECDGVVSEYQSESRVDINYANSMDLISLFWSDPNHLPWWNKIETNHYGTVFCDSVIPRGIL
jgi:hypothetical protein